MTHAQMPDAAYMIKILRAANLSTTPSRYQRTTLMINLKGSLFLLPLLNLKIPASHNL